MCNRTNPKVSSKPSLPVSHTTMDLESGTRNGSGSGIGIGNSTSTSTSTSGSRTNTSTTGSTTVNGVSSSSSSSLLTFDYQLYSSTNNSPNPSPTTTPRKRSYKYDNSHIDHFQPQQLLYKQPVLSPSVEKLSLLLFNDTNDTEHHTMNTTNNKTQKETTRDLYISAIVSTLLLLGHYSVAFYRLSSIANTTGTNATVPVTRKVRILHHTIPIYCCIIIYCYISHLYRQRIIKNNGTTTYCTTSQSNNTNNSNNSCIKYPCTNLSLLVPDIGTVSIILFILTGHLYIATFLLVVLLTIFFMIVTILDVKSLLLPKGRICSSNRDHDNNKSNKDTTCYSKDENNTVVTSFDSFVQLVSKSYMVLSSRVVYYYYQITCTLSTTCTSSDRSDNVDTSATTTNTSTKQQQHQQQLRRKKATRTILRH